MIHEPGGSRPDHGRRSPAGGSIAQEATPTFSLTGVDSGVDRLGRNRGRVHGVSTGVSVAVRRAAQLGLVAGRPEEQVAEARLGSYDNAASSKWHVGRPTAAAD